MVRHAVTSIALLVALAGCAARGHAKSPQRTSAVAFDTEEQKILACLDLRDHIVSLYADDYLAQQGLEMSAAERTAFRDGWAEQLAKKGTFERFEQTCFYSLTPNKYRCGMASQTPDGLVACMKLSAR